MLHAIIAVYHGAWHSKYATSYLNLEKTPWIRCHAALAQVDAVGERQPVDVVIENRTRTYTVFPPDRMVHLGCMLGSVPGSDREKLERRYERLKLTCRQVALSMTFPDTYR